MGLLRSLLLGRPDGLRSRLRQRFSGGAPASGAGSVAPAAAPPAPAEASLGLKPEPPRGVTPPDGFEVVLHKDALKAGKVTEIIVGGTAIAVANAAGTFYACTNVCPHAGGPLGEGTLEGATLTCPYHGWSFDLATGACDTNPGSTLKTHAVRVVDDAVCVSLA
jgi:nitrite reductase/ring-hydroxylating ferredoxin subunit